MIKTMFEVRYWRATVGSLSIDISIDKIDDELKKVIVLIL